VGGLRFAGNNSGGSQLHQSSSVDEHINDDEADITAQSPTEPSSSGGGFLETCSRWNASLPSPLSQHTLVFLVSGAMARATSATLTSPLDSIKVRVQFSRRGAAAGLVAYSGAREAARAMWVHEGVPAFFRGLPARLLYIVPAASISFVFYEQFRALYHLDAQQRAEHSRWMLGVPLLLGGLARVAGTAIRTPFDIVRQRMQIQGSLPSRAEQLKQPVHLRSLGVYRNSAEALRGVKHAEGVRALWTGLTATMLRDIPFSVVYFFAYESSKTLQARWLARSEGSSHADNGRTHLGPPPRPPSPTNQLLGRSAGDGASATATAGAVLVAGSLPGLDSDSSSSKARAASSAGKDTACASASPNLRCTCCRNERRAAGLSTPRYMLSGGFAAACAVAATMPADVVKLRLQTQGSLPPSLRYKGVRDCARAVWRAEGLAGFFRGFLPRVAYLTPSAALTFSLYEFYKSTLEKATGFHHRSEHTYKHDL
jgi:hypothetical protein